MTAEQHQPDAEQAIGRLVLFAWSCFGAPGAAFVAAEGLYRVLGLTSWRLIETTFAVVGVAGWLVFRSSGLSPSRAVTCTVISLGLVAGLLLLYSHALTGNLN